MSYTPFAYSEGLRIGTIDSVAPNEMKVLLDIEAPESVALNASSVHPFPRVNGYALTPVDDGYLVGQIEWITIERSAFPKRKGMQDFGLIDLPYPSRKMSLNPVGTLRETEHSKYNFRRGADALPSVGAPVLLPTKQQLLSIIQSGENRRVHIGASPLTADAEVSVDPDRLFGRHLAVLGNTGSGKSCSVAGLVRWSLEAAKADCQNGAGPNARFIVLDPNGEYSSAFASASMHAEVKIFKVKQGESKSALKVPLWFWNSHEWLSFTQASSQSQRPSLKRALKEVKAGRTNIEKSSDAEKKRSLRLYLSARMRIIQRALQEGQIASDKQFGFLLIRVKADIQRRQESFPEGLYERVYSALDEAISSSYNEFSKEGKTIQHFRYFDEVSIETIIEAMKSALQKLGGIIVEGSANEDIPLPFKWTDLADHLESIAIEEKTSQYVDPLVSRMRTFLSDPRIASIIDGRNDVGFLKTWLEQYISGQDATKPQITILDLSLVPTDIVHVITAVTSRMIFEALQRYRKLNNVTLPTVLIVEEAHTFAKRYNADVETYDAASICCKVFERIAREGRKHGLGLVLSSQRPSELSPTVISQCNTFLLHRISNDRDQELVKRLLPDNLRGLLRELPSLPSQYAILLGWASELPVLVKMRELHEKQRPHSDDPNYWDVWTKKDKDGNLVDRKIDWKSVADDWQNRGNHSTNED